MTHGKAHNYNRGTCKCDACHNAYLEYHRDYQRLRRAEKHHSTPNAQGRRVAVNTGALRQALSRDGRTQQRLSTDVGLYKNTVAQILRRGHCREIALDLIACGLGLHMSQLEAG